MITGKCEICGEDIHPGKDQSTFNRNRGLHLRAKHGKAGKTHHKYVREKRALQRNPQLATAASRPEPKPKRNYARKPKPTNLSIQPCALDHCPTCGSRFYISRPQ